MKFDLTFRIKWTWVVIFLFHLIYPLKKRLGGPQSLSGHDCEVRNPFHAPGWNRTQVV